MKGTKITLTILFLLTLASMLMSNKVSEYTIPIILILAAIKFIGIAFNFMELKKAHVFWKISTLAFLVIFIGTILIIL